MVYTSLAVLALSASSALSPISKLVHLHRHPAMDGRVSVTLLNASRIFQDVKVAGHRYTILPNHQLQVKAPVGTDIVAASSTGGLHEGEVVVSLTVKLQNQSIVLK